MRRKGAPNISLSSSVSRETRRQLPRKDESSKLTLVEGLPPQTLQLLHEFVRLLDQWRKITNLISETGFQEIWERHIEDSLRVQALFPSAGRWLDLGAGAGFPGLIIGMVVAERQDARIHCVESDGRKCAFLRLVADSLQLPVKVYNCRAESISILQTGRVDAVTARAFASVEEILEVVKVYLKDGAVAVLPRGQSSVREIETLDARRYITGIATHDNGVITVVGERVTGN